MPEMISTSSLKQLLGFPFRGEEWTQRFVVGSALVLAGFFIPILPLIFAAGYILDVARRAIRGEEPALPAWKDWGTLAADGLRSAVATFVYTLPASVCILGGYAVYTFGIVLSAGAESQDPATALRVLGALIVFLAALGLGILLWVLAAAVLPVALGHLALHGRLGAAFDVDAWWPLLWRNKLGWLAAWVVVSGLYSLVSLVVSAAYFSVVLCCLIPLLMAPVSFYLSVVGAALFGQTYRESAALVAEAPQAAPA